MNQAAIKFRGGTTVSAGPDGITKQRKMTMNRYSVEYHGGHGNHKTWRVVRRYDKCIMCVCVYMRGAIRACEELNALAGGSMGTNQKEDQYV